MRILYLIDNFSLGGAQIVVKGIMENHPGHKDLFAVALRIKEPLVTIDHPQVKQFGSKLKYSFRPLIYLNRFISMNRIEMIHCQLPRSILFGYLLKCLHPDIRYIIHEQGDVFESRMHARLLRLFRKKADGFIACSRSTGEALQLRSKVDAADIRVIYNFVDPGRFIPKRNFSGKIRKIGFAGRIEQRKGWREFVDLAGHFQANERISFHMAGTGSEEKKLLRIIRECNYPNLSFSGFIQDMQKFYHEIDLLIIPSHFEPMGMVAIEAMACGVPVLANDVPGLNEVVRHGVNGWVYPEGTASALIRAAGELMELDPDQLVATAERAIAYADDYSFPAFWKRLMHYYED